MPEAKFSEWLVRCLAPMDYLGSGIHKDIVNDFIIKIREDKYKHRYGLDASGLWGNSSRLRALSDLRRDLRKRLKRERTRLERLEQRAAGGDATSLGGPSPRSPFEVASAREEEQSLRRCIEGLSAEARRIVELRFFRGWKLKQIAAELNLNMSEVFRKLAAALDSLRHCLSTAGVD